MIILDTNVVAILMGSTLSEPAEQWIARQSPAAVHLTAITRGEIRCGVARLPEGRRRDALQRSADMLFTELTHRTLAFDDEAADAYGVIVAARERMGRPIGVADAQIAAIARAHGAIVATRDVDGFARTGIGVIDPFAS